MIDLELQERERAEEEELGGPVKCCSRCGEWLPADTEFFPRNGPRLSSWCKACWSERKVEH